MSTVSSDTWGTESGLNHALRDATNSSLLVISWAGKSARVYGETFIKERSRWYSIHGTERASEPVDMNRMSATYCRDTWVIL